MNHRVFFGLFLTLALALCAAAAADVNAQSARPPANRPAPPAAELPTWEQLTPAQREAILATLRDRWNANPRERARILNHAQRWQQMTPEERRRAEQGRKRWEKMTPQQRAEARAAFERRRALSPEQRAALREKLRGMPPEERRAWLREERERQRVEQGLPAPPPRSRPAQNPPAQPQKP